MFGFKDRKMLSDELKEAESRIKALEESLKNEQEKNERLKRLLSDVKQDMSDLGEGLNALDEKEQRISKAYEEAKNAEADAKDAAAAAREEMGKMEQGFGRMTEAFASQKSKVNKLMEDSKEYTGISKALQSMVETYKNAVSTISGETKKMGEYAGNMGTLSLNAAIEAGRMGESGMHFVKASDEVRSYAENYEASAGILKEQVKEIDASFAKSASSVERLIILLKDNTLLLKKISDSCLDEVTFGETFEGKRVEEAFTDIDERNARLKEAIENTEGISEDMRLDRTDLSNVKDRLERNINSLDDILKDDKEQ